MKWKFWPVVEYSPNHLKVKGSSPATTAGTGRVKLAKKREANVWDQPVVRDRCLPRRTLVQIRWRQDNGVHRQRREWSSCREDIQRPSVFERVGRIHGQVWSNRLCPKSKPIRTLREREKTEMMWWVLLGLFLLLIYSCASIQTLKLGIWNTCHSR